MLKMYRRPILRLLGDADPKYVIYVHGKTRNESYLKTRNVLSRLVAIYLEFASDPTARIETSTRGPSFSKMLTPMIWYTQGGYVETRERHIIGLKTIEEKKLALEKAGFGGPNFFKPIDCDDPGEGLGPSPALLASLTKQLP